MRAALCAGGALFFGDLLARLRLLPSQLETALSELAGQGLAACDGFTGLRPRRPPADARGAGDADGRRGPLVLDGDATRLGRAFRRGGTGRRVDIEGGAELAARVLLDRHGGGVPAPLSAGALAAAVARAGRGLYRRREARGELRGGRFLALASGEQFALPEAVGLLREVRRRAKSLELVSLSGSDPLNLTGIVTPGATVPRGSGRVLYLDGVPIASQSGREVHMSEALDRGTAWEARKALLRRGVGATRLSVGAGGTTSR